MPRRLLTTAGLCVLICVFALDLMAKPGVVKTKNGQTIEGDITERGDGSIVVTTKSNLSVTLQASQVENVSYAEDIKTQYQQRVAAMPANATASDHVEVAKWLFDHKAYDLARQELDKAQAKDPNSSDAALLRQTIDRSAAWDRRTTTPAPPANAQPRPRDPGPGVAPAPAAAGPKRLLTADDINVIKLQELKPDADAQIRVRFEGDVLRRLATHANMNIREIQALPDLEKLKLVFSRGDAEMRKDTKIQNDPSALLQYKQRIQPILLQGCAAANCHTPQHTGSLILHQGGNEQAYTNFYVLTQYKLTGADGTPQGRLIDRTRPEKSLILQFGLPFDQAEFDHPEVQNFRPTFRSAQDLRYQEVLRWVRESLVTLEPNYNIDYPVHGANAAPAQPAAPQPAANQQRPAANPNPPPNQNKPEPAENSPEDALRNARERMRPIRPTIPF